MFILIKHFKIALILTIKMSLSKQIQDVFQKIQMTAAAHRRYIKVLVDLYKKNDIERFYAAFEPFFCIVIYQNGDNCFYTKRCLSFVSQFCVASQVEEREISQNILYKLLDRTLKFTSADVYHIRYNASLFIALLLQDVGEKIEIHAEALDQIQEAMLRSMQDTKVSIRLQAISALIRLQDPENLDCPVTLAYKLALSSTNSKVRSEVLKNIAPNRSVFNDISLRIYDVDKEVRCTAFHKCADVGPFAFKIIDKHKILKRGFHEEVPSVENVFKSYFLSKWLTAFEGNYLNFIKSLKLNADESDMKQFKYISTLLIKEFLSNHPFSDIVAVLPFENKVIKYEELNNEVSMFWSILVNLLMESRKDDDCWKEVICPELTNICIYIERFAKEKLTNKQDEWQFLQYQFDLINLLEISEHMDFSDEVGRQNMKKLSISLLQNHHFEYTLTKKLVLIAEKCSTNIEIFTGEVCDLVAGIVKQEIIDKPSSKTDLLQRNFKIAELKVAMNILKESQREAVEKRDYHTAGILEIELKNSLTMLENLQSPEPKRNIRTQIENICRGLDVLSGSLESVNLIKLTPALSQLQNTFLEPLLSHKKTDINYRVLKCLALMSIIDVEMAKKYFKFISKPFTLYNGTETVNKSLLITSINSVSDLISIHGKEIIENIDATTTDISNRQATMNGTTHTSEDETTVNSTNQMNLRRLYKTGDGLITTYLDESITITNIYEQVLKILDDDNEEIRFSAAVAIATFFKSVTPVTPFLVSRVIIKWYSPLTEKDDKRIQCFLGKAIEEFITSKDCGEVFKAAIYPTLSTIINAPKTSPLSEIPLDNLVAFLAEICNMVLSGDAIKMLVLDIQMKIIEKPQDKLTASFVKLLHRLDLDQADLEGVEEVKRKSRHMLEVLPNKILRRSVSRMLEKLCLSDKQTVIEEEDTSATNNNSNNDQLQISRIFTQSNNDPNVEQKQSISEPVANGRKRKRTLNRQAQLAEVRKS